MERPISYYILPSTNTSKRSQILAGRLSSLGLKLEPVEPGAEGVQESPLHVIVVADEGAALDALRLACMPWTRASLIVYTQWSVRSALMIRENLSTCSRVVHQVLVRDVDEPLSGITPYLKGYRAAASALDLKLLLFGAEYDVGRLRWVTDTLDPDYYVFPWSEASATIDEGIEYSELYIDSYLSAYFNLEGLDRDKLSRSLGLYLAVKSVLDSEGANAVVLDCDRLRVEKGFEAWTTINLLLDEGVPTSCIRDVESIAIHAISMALSGKPSWTPGGYELEGVKLVLKGSVAPTLLFQNPRLVDRGGYYTPTGKIKEGVYLMASIGYKNMAAHLSEVKVESRDEGGVPSAAIVDPPDLGALPGPHIYLIPYRGLIDARVALEVLGFNVDTS